MNIHPLQVLITRIVSIMGKGSDIHHANNALLEAMVEERIHELKLLQAQKLSDLYRFADFGRISSGLFHDLMNPLTAIIGTIDQLRSNPDKLPELEEYLQKAVSSSNRMKAILQATRKQTAISEIETEFSPDKEILEAITILGYRARETNTTIKIHLKKNLLIKGNPLKFHQIAINLIANAIDAVEMAKRKHPLITIELHHKGMKMIFIIRDNGVGIAPEYFDKVFDVFFTTKKLKGMGLGLSTTKDSIEHSFGGTISLSSVVGKGTIFIVRIPLHIPSNIISCDCHMPSAIVLDADVPDNAHLLPYNSPQSVQYDASSSATV